MKVFVQTKDGHNRVKDLNRRKSIRELCLNCCGWTSSEVRKCKHIKCALHLYRTGNGNQNAKAREKAIRAYCLWCSGGKPSEVTQCPVPDCPLFAFRKQRLDRSVEIDSAIKKRPIEFVSLAN